MDMAHPWTKFCTILCCSPITIIFRKVDFSQVDLYENNREWYFVETKILHFPPSWHVEEVMKKSWQVEVLAHPGRLGRKSKCVFKNGSATSPVWS